MAYQENYIQESKEVRPNTYVIENDVEDVDYVDEQKVQPVRINQNSKYEESEAIQPVDMSADIAREIHDTAVAEGLVDENEAPFGGEGNPTPEAVISDFMNQKRPEAVEKKVEEYTEKKVENTKKVIATREILTGMAKRLITVTVPVVLDIQKEDGTVGPELIDLELKVKRLTESQVNHLYNRRMAGKTVDEMTNEELQEDNHFRAKFLAEAVVEPQMSFEEWYNGTPAIATGTIFNAVNEALSSIDDTSLFQ